MLNIVTILSHLPHLTAHPLAASAPRGAAASIRIIQLPDGGPVPGALHISAVASVCYRRISETFGRRDTELLVAANGHQELILRTPSVIEPMMFLLEKS